MGDLIYLTGPVRSGKSARAVELAHGWGDDVVFVATYRRDPTDAEMEARLHKHRDERPTGWRTLEAPDDIGAALDALDPPPAGVIIDSLVIWLAERVEHSDQTILSSWTRELEKCRAAPWPVVVIGDEIGWSPVPMDPSLRRFRDLAGLAGQRTAAAATEAWLMVSGLAVRLK